ncbi:hypothetical protein pb186bvf_003371 [Paramecium bursaria]
MTNFHLLILILFNYKNNMNKDENLEFFMEEDFNKEQKDYLDISTQTTSNNGSMAPVVRKRNQQTQRSLLVLTNENKQTLQRRGSNSMIDSLQVIEEEIQAADKVFTVYWFDSSLSIRHEIIIQTTQSISIKEFLQLVIAKFNKDNEFLYAQLPVDGQYELYYAKKNGMPKEDFSKFDPNVQLKTTNIDRYALKVIRREKPQCMSTHQEPQPIKVSWWQRLNFCCKE